MEENRLKRIREWEGDISQAKLADFIGVALHKIRDAETGKTKISSEIAFAIEEKLGYSFRWVLSGDGDPKVVLSEKHDEYHTGDPILAMILVDYQKLSDVGKLRLATFAKEELQRQKEEADRKKKPIGANEKGGGSVVNGD